LNSPTKEPPKASLDDISVGREIAEREKPRPDSKDELEKANLDNAKLGAEVDALKSRTAMRERYEKKVFRYLVGYSVVATVMLFSCGLGWMKLPENVLLAIAGSTAVAAIGLVAQIGKGLFGSTDDQPKS